jgi:hypothetical protein
MATNSKWYCNAGNMSTTGYFAVAKWAATTAYTVGNLIRQKTAPAVGSERVYVCVVAGTSGSTEPTYGTTKGIVFTDGTVNWQECTGIPAVNGDASNTPAWTASQTWTRGQIIKDIAGTHYFIAQAAGSVAGGTGSEPTWGASTLGTQTTDGSETWTYIGLVSTFAGTPWGAPHCRIGNAIVSTWMAAGDTLYVSNNHAETTSTTSFTWTFPGTASNPNRIECVVDTAAPPTATAQTATATSTLSGTAMTSSGCAHVYGVSCSLGSGAVAATATLTNLALTMEACNMTIAGTTSTNGIVLGASGGPSLITFVDTTVSFANAGHTIKPWNCYFIWKGTLSALGGTMPTTLFTTQANVSTNVEVTGVDLSGLGSGKNLVSVATGCAQTFSFRNCQLGSSVSVITGTIASEGQTRVFLENCDSANTNYRMEHYRYEGTVKAESSTVGGHYRTSGASDGTTTISHNMTCLASGPSLFWPLESPWMTIWNDTTGTSKTLTVEVCTENVILTNSDCYLEVEYLNSSTLPISTYQSTRVTDIFATPSNLSTSTATWNGFTTPKPQYISTSFTPLQKGPIRARLCVTKPSASVYVDPLLTVV